MHTSMTFIKTGPDRTEQLPDLESVAWSKAKTHIHMPQAFWLSTSDRYKGSGVDVQKFLVRPWPGGGTRKGLHPV